MVVKDLLKTVDRLNRADVIPRGLRPEVVLVNRDKQVGAYCVKTHPSTAYGKEHKGTASPAFPVRVTLAATASA